MDRKNILKEVNYYYITDDKLELTPSEQVRLAVENGVRMVQYRAKNISDKMMYEDCLKIREIVPEDVLFIVNDRPDIAISVRADGVHLGQDDLPPEVVKEIVDENIVIGVSTHDLQQALEAERIADYIGIGPVHTTDTKRDTSDELGIEKVLEIASKVEVPTTAIGGIEESDLEELATELDMICAISSVTQRDSFKNRIKKFEQKFSKAKKGV